MKKTIQSIIGSALIIFIAMLVFGVFSENKKSPQKNNKNLLKTIETQQVINKTIPIQIKSTGSVLAKDRSVIYSEVTGIFKSSSKPYKPGVSYNKGQALIRIDNAEYAASVKSQRVNFKSLITSTLADIQFDYPEELNTWQKYANTISAENYLPKLPETSNTIFLNYLSGKSIPSTYYSIKNLETRLAKYTITAPYSGVLVATEVTTGTLVSPGQKLGEFIKPGIYELELNVNASMTNFLKLGKKVTLFNTDHSKTYKGKVSRINSLINRATQTVQIFVEVISKDISEGEYLEADIEAQEVSGVFEINRNIIVDQNSVFTVKEGALIKQPISIIHANDDKVIVRGIKESSELVITPITGGYEGMKVVVKN